MNINWTLVGQSLTFFVFVWFCKSYIWPPIVTAMRERQAAIAEGLASSERASKDLELAQDHATQQLREAKNEAQQIIEQARGRANQMIDEAKGDAREEGERIKEAARAEVEQEVNRAKEVLRGQVATLALAGAEKVLGSIIDADKHSELLDQLAADL
ncbi:MAG: F0F1 ATP synthase subunit B [Gammaproteobacteria bacterium]|jgi:F-type H+-transporting ATPase subunit b|nr:F0F1 ATP synthase subunit B [Gammaproteobacteria bacterium]